MLALACAWVLAAAADTPCCQTCTPPLEKYFSVDAPHGMCGECCIDPKKYGTYKVFEKNLTKATVASPCAQQWTVDGRHYTQYEKTDTHGVPGLLAVTLDMYGPGPTLRETTSPCCKTCAAGTEKYFSVDAPHGMCGECCIDPKKYGTYKVFEKNLTKATVASPCAQQWTVDGRHYTQYEKTDTHGVPGLLAVTLDMYGPGPTVAATAGPCCRTCPEGTDKYFSVVTKNGQCGESCIAPNKYATFKLLERNLTKAVDATPCGDASYPVYKETETHGVPGILSIEVDMYQSS